MNVHQQFQMVSTEWDKDRFEAEHKAPATIALLNTTLIFTLVNNYKRKGNTHTYKLTKM